MKKSTTILFGLIFIFILAHEGWGQTPYPMSSGDYSESFSDIANWANNFTSGTGANRWGSVAINSSGTIPDGITTTKASDTWVTSTNGGIQKGTQAFIFLSTGTSPNANSVAADLFLDFTGRNAGTLSFDWTAIDNSSGTRPTSLRVYWSTNGTTFTEITAAQVLEKTSSSSGSITTIALPSNFNNSSTARLRFYNHAGSATGSGTRDKMQIDNISITSTASGNTAPTLTLPVSSGITNLGATLGATISSNGGVSITESGIVYGTSANPTGNAVQTSPLVTTGAYTVSSGTLSPQTLYYYRGYAVNTIGTGYSSDGTFRTFSNPPTGQASNLGGSPTSTNALNITWSAATFPISGAFTTGYVLLRATSPNVPTLTNSNGAAPTGDANTTIVSYSISGGSTSQAVSSLTANTTYNFLLVPFCWDGTNAATYNYLTASAPTASVSTPSNSSDVVAVASSESATISSLVNDAAPLNSTTGVQVWQITVRDGGSANNDADNLPTIISGITLSQNSGNAVDNWQEAIKTIALFDGTNFIASASSITSTTIVFSGLSVNVADNSNKTLSLRLSLNATLNNVGSGNLDGDDFVFSITNANFSTPIDGTSSTKAAFTTASSSNSGLNIISVVATKLAFLQQPSNVATNTNMTPAVTVQATDIGGNRDKDFTSSIEITATGSTLTGSPVSVAAVSGLSTFSTLQFSVAGTGVTLNAAFTGLTGATSNSFNVTLPLSAYIFRSLRTGNWSGVANGNETWESSSDEGQNWAASSIAPNSSAGSITVRSGHTVTITSSTDADQLTIDSTGQVTINSGQTFTIADGTGTDATVKGYLKNTGTLTNNGQMTFGNGSTYEHKKDGGTIPTATWDANSTILVTGASTTQPTFSSLVTYGNVTWNCSSQGSALNFSGNLRNIAGNLTVSNTNSYGLRLTGGTGYTFTIGGNIIINNSTATLQVANGTSSGNVLNIGGWNQTTGNFDPNIGTSNVVAINFTNSNGSFNQSAGTLTNTYINWTVNTGASLTLSSNLPVASSRTFTVNGTLDCGSSQVTGSGAFTLSSGATLKTASETGVSGSIFVSGTKTFNSAANYEFNGNATGTFTSTANNIKINNSSGTVSLDQDLSVNGTLTLTNGALSIGAKTLTLNGAISTTSGTLTGGSSSKITFGGSGSSTTLPAVTNGLNNLTINRGNGITLGGDNTVSGTLTMISGLLNTSSHTLYFGTSANNPTESATSYINGTAVMNQRTAGTGALNFLGCNISEGNEIGNVNLTRKTGSAGASTINNYNSISANWELSSSTNGSRTITYSWNSALDNGNDFSVEKSAQLYKYVSSSWTTSGNGKVISAGTRQYQETIDLSSTSTQYTVAIPSSYNLYTQNFNTDNWTGTNSSQPDANWTNGVTTGNTSWRLNNQNSTNNSASWSYPNAGKIKSYGNTGYSAQFHTYSAASSESGTLDLKLDFSTVGTKELSFYYTNATGSDYLEVSLSTNNGLSFGSVLGTYYTGSWSKKTITLGTMTDQNCVIRFKATSDFGRDDIGIDNVEVNVVRYSYTVDPGMLSIDMNANYNTGAFKPQATVKNYGTSTLSSFDVTMTITGGYTSTKTVSSLAANGTSQVEFASWNPTEGSYTVSVSTTLSSDQNTANNTLTKSVGVSSGTWSEGLVIPTATYLGSATGYTDGLNNKYLYVTGGVGAETKFYKYNVGANEWTTLPDITAGKIVHASAIVGNYLYVIGGANSGGYQSTVYRFNLSNESGTWETMTPLTKPIGWCKAVAYGNYIYLVGGFTTQGGSQALGDVYVYNTSNNTWTAGTSLNGGKTRFGGALSIVGDKLVYVAGATGSSSLTNEVLIGQIDAPTTISWSVSSSPFPGNGEEVRIPSDINLASLEFPRKNSKSEKDGDGPMSVYPAGSLYCLDAAPWGTSSIIIAGGTDGVDGNPEDPSLCYSFDLSSWSPKQNLPTPVYGSGLGTVSDASNWYLILASGYKVNGSTTKTQKFTVTSSGGQPQSLNLSSLLEGGNNTDNPPQAIVTVELRQSTSPYTVADTKTMVQNGAGFGTTEFNNIDASKPYYIVVRYANGIETWSAQPQYFVSGQMTYDFTTAQTQAYGGNMVNINGKWCIISGDIDQDGKINAMDRGICWNDRGTDDVYSDLNRDGTVNELDRAILSKNKNLAVKRPEGAVSSKLKIGKKISKVTSD